MLNLISEEFKELTQNFPFALEALNNTLAVDIETAPKDFWQQYEDAALNPFTSQITLVGFFGVLDGVPYGAQFDKNSLKDLGSFFLHLSEKGIKLTGHNAKFDLKMLISHGHVNLESAKNLWFYDSSILAAVNTKRIPEFWLTSYEEKRRELNKRYKLKHRQAKGGSLKTLAPYFLGVEAFWETTNHSDPKYNALDCLYTFFLTAELLKQVEGLSAASIAEDLVARAKMLLIAEVGGIKLDMDTLRQVEAEDTRKRQQLTETIEKQWHEHFEAFKAERIHALKLQYESMARIQADKRDKPLSELWPKYEALYEKALSKADLSLNLNSPEQLKWLLKGKLGYDITDLKDEHEENTGKAVLEHLSAIHHDVANLVAYRKTNKLLTSFYPTLADAAQFDGRVHPSFNITGARTGRLSSSSPNVQQIPKGLRHLFIAEKGNVLVDLDMSMLEPILIAYYSGDPLLTELINSGKSFHSYNAMVMFGLSCDIDDVAKLHKKERQAAKLAGLSILYGSGARQLHFSLTGIGYKFSLTECQEIVKRIRDTYKGVWDFKRELDRIAEAGEVYYNYLGRPIKFDDKDEIYMKNFNGLIQGSGSDIVVQSAVDFLKAAPYASPRILVHDSICVEVPEERAEEAIKMLDYHMTKWDIGNLKFKTEGGYKKSWDI